MMPSHTSLSFALACYFIHAARSIDKPQKNMVCYKLKLIERAGSDGKGLKPEVEHHMDLPVLNQPTVWAHYLLACI